MTTFKMPKPQWLGDIPGYTEAQLKQCMRDVLEMAAQRCELVGLWPSLGPKNCAESIREMKEQI